ncbi:GAF domain-containing sensor histidine kinase [Heliorestis convoluta]|uniref:histidine kinase n=1 Tax=Heliorestis convoluta TaxID=356322 RepID=A0A5Q2MZV3_9FIRM|nr:GAF domain-containing sensor histidine kinase [Heliorestis convoluta]QGG46472.1 GAF domain [Heliorestis convoluta]
MDKSLQDFVNHSPMIVIVWQCEDPWKVKFISNAICQFGYDPQEILSGKISFLDLIYSEDRHRYIAAMKNRFLATCQEYTLEYRIVTKEGQIRWVEAQKIISQRTETKQFFHQDILIDVTRRKGMEEALYRKDRLLHGVAAATNSLLTTYDFNHAIIQALNYLGEAVEVDRVYIFRNHEHSLTGAPAVSQTFEWSRDNIVPQIDNPVLQDLPYEEIGLLWWYKNLKDNKTINGLVKDFPEAERSVLEPQGIISLLVVPIFIGKEFWGFVGFDDCHSERIWTKEEESILMVAAASIGGAIQRKEAESALQLSEEELRIALEKLSRLNETLEERVFQEVMMNRQKDMMLQQQSRQVAMGEIINSIAHQWRQPLNSISLAASNIVIDVELGENLEEIAEEGNQIIELAQSMSQTITDFMEFFNDNKKEEFFRVEDVLKSIGGMLQSQLYSKNIAYQIRLPEKIEVKAFRNELQQVLLNIITNAIHAFDEKKVERKMICAHGWIEHGPEEQEHLILEIADNAGGVPEEIMEKIFEPYITTKEKGKGTGLGLSISRTIVQDKLKGNIVVRNENGGAVFSLNFPVSSSG